MSDTILRSVSDGIITVNGSGRIISVNKAFEKMTGVPASAAVGLSICDVFRFSEENVVFRLSLGEGLPEEKMPHLTESFYKAGADRRLKGQGSDSIFAGRLE